MFRQKTALTDELKKKDVKLVTPELFFDCWERKRLLSKCQEVLPEFFVDVDALTDEELGKLEVVAISYCWIAQKHPDPGMYHLEIVYHLLRKFVVGTFDKTKFHRSDGSSFILNSNEVCGSGDGRRLGIFLDWSSVPQQARSVEDTAVFKRALSNINLWYAHSSTTTWMLTSLPPDVTRKGYEESGWTTFERHVASLISPSTQVLRIDVGVREKLCRGALQCDYYQLCLDTMDISHGAPVEPAAFTRDVRAKHFTNDADYYDVVVPRYKDTFLSVMEEATAIDYRGQSVSDGAFWDIMAAFQTYGHRELIEVIDFSFSELSVSLEEGVTSALGFNLRKLFLGGSSNLGGGLSNISKFQNL